MYRLKIYIKNDGNKSSNLYITAWCNFSEHVINRWAMKDSGSWGLHTFITEELKEFHAVYDVDLREILFETEEDATMFILKWS